MFRISASGAFASDVNHWQDNKKSCSSSKYVLCSAYKNWSSVKLPLHDLQINELASAFTATLG